MADGATPFVVIDAKEYTRKLRARVKRKAEAAEAARAGMQSIPGVTTLGGKRIFLGGKAPVAPAGGERLDQAPRVTELQDALADVKALDNQVTSLSAQRDVLLGQISTFAVLLDDCETELSELKGELA